MTPGALSDLRVLEYSDNLAGAYCARLLADAGAEVVKVEPPGGDPHRRLGPFVDGVADPAWSGLYLYLNANKRGIILDLVEERHLSAFRDLVSRVDVLILDQPPEVLERFRLRRHYFQEQNSRIIVTAITPFGLTGPYRDYAGDDLIAVCAGGLAFATPGVPDMVRVPDQEPPLRANVNVSEYLAAVQAAVAVVAALMQRSVSGTGCEIDLSLQEAVSMAVGYDLAHASYFEPKTRAPVIFGLMPNAYLPCKDGYVVIMAVLEPHWRGLMELAGDPDWAQLDTFATGEERARNWDALEPLLLEWTMGYTGQEIAQQAQEKGVPCFPAYTVGQMVESEHVAARDYLWSFTGPQGKEFKLPGYPVAMEATPWRLRRPAPGPGEHTDEVLQEWLGYSNGELNLLHSLPARREAR